jgi:hypothetical protein
VGAVASYDASAALRSPRTDRIEIGGDAVGLPRELIRDVRRLDEYELRRLLILVRGLLVHVDGAPETDEPGLPTGLRYRQEHVRCGKATCGSCPHGPYWYAVWKEDGRTRKRYIGRHLPGQTPERVVPDLAEDAAPAAPAPSGSRQGRDDARS